MSDNTILGIKPFSDYMSVAEVAAKVMQGQQPIEEEDEAWLDDEARDVEHKWKRMNTKLRVKWLAQIKVKADKEDMDQYRLDRILDDYGLTKFPKEKVWHEAQKIKPKWKKMSTAERTQWVDKLHVIAVKARTSDADVQSILDDAKLKIKEEVEIEEEFWAVIDKAKGGEVMAVSSDEKGAKSSVKMSNFSKHDYHFNKDPRTLKIVKVAGSYKKGEKMIGTKLSFKEEVEVDESNELQAIMALDDVGIEATINKKDQVVVKKKDLKKAEAALKKSFKKGGAPELHGEEVKIGEKLEKESYGSFITAAAKAKKEGKKTFMMGGKKYPVTIKQKISAAYEEAEVEEAKLYAAKGTAYPATIDTLKMIVKDKQNQTIMFKDGKAMVDLFTASAMTQVYDALKKPEIKKSFEKMILDKAGFLKAQGFAMKMISGK